MQRMMDRAATVRDFQPLPRSFFEEKVVPEREVTVEQQPLAIGTPFYYSFHFLDKYFTALTKLDYPKELISLYFPVQGEDETDEMVLMFKDQYEHKYKSITTVKRPVFTEGISRYHCMCVNVCSQRNWIVEQSKPLDLLFIGHDNFLPRDAINRLLTCKAYGADIMAGVYAFYAGGLGLTSFFKMDDTRYTTGVLQENGKLWVPTCLLGHKVWTATAGMDSTFVRREVLNENSFEIKATLADSGWSDDVKFCSNAIEKGFKVMTDYGMFVEHWGFKIQFLQPPVNWKTQILCSIETATMKRRMALHRWRETTLEEPADIATYIQESIQALKKQVSKCQTIKDYVTLAMKHRGGHPDIRPAQSDQEITALLKKVEELKPKIVVEIGTYKGGTLFLWCSVAHPDATLISVDLPKGHPEAHFGGGYLPSKIPFFESFAHAQQKVHLVYGKSCLPSTIKKIKKILDGRKIDFLFIDGDHRYPGVKCDFTNYSPMVRKGGIIAFHDILHHPQQPSCKVEILWKEIKNDFRHEEFIHKPPIHKMGIGVIYV